MLIYPMVDECYSNPEQLGQANNKHRWVYGFLCREFMLLLRDSFDESNQRTGHQFTVIS